ncbi:MAG: DUF2171 domain-containing protein [Sphingomicrobium sp.]
MVSSSDIRKDMDVLASDGQRIGRVDEVEDNRIKVTREGSPDGQHHYVPLTDVSRVDSQVHLSRSHAELHGGGAAAAGARPLRDHAVGGAAPRNLLPWILGGLALLLLLLALSQCGHRNTAAVAVPHVAGAPLREGSLAYDVDRFLASKDGLPRTFTFDRINFDSGTAALREEDRGDLDDLARVLASYPHVRAAVVGYTDAQGPASTNRELGAQRAQAVVSALAQRGIDPSRIDARTGGEDNPAATNANAPGRFDNRRSELVILRR